jgi:chromate reductase
MIEIIVGTNRRNSASSILAKCLLKYYQDLRADAQIMDLLELPPETFSPDSYKDKPQKVLKFTDRILSSTGLVIVTPEYNGSMPGSLKLFIDLLPFPESFEGRPVCYVGLAAGQFGALRPVEHLMQVFSYRNAHNFPNRVFLPHSHNLIDLQKGVTDEATADRLHNQAQGFIGYCNLLKSQPAIE